MIKNIFSGGLRKKKIFKNKRVTIRPRSRMTDDRAMTAVILVPTRYFHIFFPPIYLKRIRARAALY